MFVIQCLGTFLGSLRRTFFGGAVCCVLDYTCPTWTRMKTRSGLKNISRTPLEAVQLAPFPANLIYTPQSGNVVAGVIPV